MADFDPVSYMMGAKAGGGGGGGLPAPTAADLGEGLRIKNGNDSTVVTIVPTQTVTNTGEDVELQNAVASAFAVGAECTAEINGNTFSSVSLFDPENDVIYVSFWDDDEACEYYFHVSDGKVYFGTNSATESLVISLTKTTYNAVWGIESNFDLVIHLDGGFQETSGATLVKGSYADAATKLALGKPISVWVDSICVVRVGGGDQIEIELLEYTGQSTLAYVAGQSGASPTVKVDIPMINLARLYIHPDNTVTGWWN